MAGNWRVANSLLTLRNQVDTLYPGRNKASDGTIGDAAHAATQSDHNPDENNVVAAIDITNDPEHGLDIAQLFKQLQLSRDPRIKYIIANRKIVIPANGWHSVDYIGSDPHTSHLHLSVNKSNYDDNRQWAIGGTMEEVEKLKSYIRTLETFIRDAGKKLGLDFGPYIDSGDFDAMLTAIGNQIGANDERVKIIARQAKELAELKAGLGGFNQDDRNNLIAVRGHFK